MSESMADQPKPRYRPGRGTNLSLTAPCLYPGCGNPVTLRLRGGLPTYFCSADCRSNYRNISQQLERTKSELVTSREAGALSDAERQAALRLVDWHLARFLSKSR